ncbi:hypothetical protein BC828DRAFT_410107 [Blastocladiella britannica]|nr:hypothetical protein BC828DRAFT_410107 [Blastocladiella britannica]
MDQLAVSSFIADAMLSNRAMTALTPEPITAAMTTTEQQQPAPRSAPPKRTVATLSDDEEDGSMQPPAKERRVDGTTTTSSAAAVSVTTVTTAAASGSGSGGGGMDGASVGREFPGGSSDRGGSVALVGDAGTVSDQQQCRGPDGSGSVPDAADTNSSSDDGSGMSSTLTSAATAETTATDTSAAKDKDEEPDPADVMAVDDVGNDDDCEAIYRIPDGHKLTTEEFMRLAAMYEHALLMDGDTSGDDGSDSSDYDGPYASFAAKSRRAR